MSERMEEKETSAYKQLMKNAIKQQLKEGN